MSALCCRCLFRTKRQRCSAHSPVALPLDSSLVVSSYRTGQDGWLAFCLVCSSAFLMPSSHTSMFRFLCSAGSAALLFVGWSTDGAALSQHGMAFHATR